MGNLFAEAKLKTALANDTYTDKKEIVSKAGYLLGVDKSIFDSGELLSEIYEELEKNQDARMVRNLCFLFTCIEHCYKQLQMQMVNDLKNLHSMDMTKAATEALRKDGLDIVKANCTLDEYRPRIAAEIANRIQGCKDIFPMWVPWEYIRQMFSFPTKTKDRAQERAWLYYNENIIRFPYNVFLNWQFKADEGGNLLGSDEQFLIRLYAQNGDTFCEYDKVRGESKQTQQNVEQFLLHSVRSEILVDCENCDPLKFFAVLQSLSPEAIGKIQKIFLFDDVNASSIWGLVEHYTKAKVDRFMTQRVVEGKSVVDMTVAVCCCQEHYDKKIDSFLLFSSDSDYWPLINNVVTARFLMMFEREKTSKAIVNKMREHHVLYCYTDQFCKAGDAYRLRNDALALECASYLKQQLGSCNIEDTVFCCPPSGAANLRRWVKKGSFEAKKKGTTVVMLLPVSTDSQWFQEHIYLKPGVRVKFLPERVKFVNRLLPSYAEYGQHGAASVGGTRPSMVVVFDGSKRKFCCE